MSTNYREPNYYLSLNDKDELYQNTKRSEESYSESFKREIRMLSLSDNKVIRRLLHTYSEYYRDGMTYSDYYDTIVSSIGEGNFDKGLNIIGNELIRIADKLIGQIKGDIDKDDILRCLMFQNFYKTYIGFWNETILKSKLVHSGLFNVYANNTLDKEYKIDLVVQCKIKGYEAYRIGIQCKSQTFKNLSAYSMRTYQNGNERAIEEGVVNDVYYVLNDNLTIIGTQHNNGLEHYKLIDKDNNYMSIADEDFIRGLLYKIWCLNDDKEVEEMAKNEPFGGFAFKVRMKTNIADRFNKWYETSTLNEVA